MVLRRWRSQRDQAHDRRQEAAAEVHAQADVDDESLIEIEVVGESHRQHALEQIAGGKDESGKQLRVGVTLRAEPSNEYDRNAVRVECYGQLLGYVARRVASILSGPIQAHCGGALEARGLIVGGWRHRDSEGHFGIRVWVTDRDASRLGLAPHVLDPSRRAPRMAWPELPAAGPDERRISPTAADLEAQRWGRQVTVTCEEHYQPVIEAAMPAGWEDDRSWLLLVELVMAECNPHAKTPVPCIEVRLNGACIGFFTPAMTDRYRRAVVEAGAGGNRVTATAQASRGTKAGASVWDLKVFIVATEDT
jgi:hypothetical protein